MKGGFRTGAEVQEKREEGKEGRRKGGKEIRDEGKERFRTRGLREREGN